MNELERCGRKRSWPNLRYYPDICLGKVMKTKNNLNQDSWCLDGDMNRSSSERMSEALPLGPACW
jgi:hypothetical protein